ncbi:MAG TPA: helix-turn-helix domain-containing protein [Dehalococcoidia bacterium]|nr:helix-turn-helix domain-containing protein [Dehalococcoidia bacterium]
MTAQDPATVANLPLEDSELRAHLPNALLRPYIREITAYREVPDGTVRRQTLPLDKVVVILGFESPMTIGTDRGRRMDSHKAFVAGLTDQPGFYEFGQASSGIQMNMTPLGARLLLDRPMSEVANQVVEVDDLFGTTGPELIERLREAQDWDSAFSLLESFVAARIADARPASPAVAWAWRALAETGGRVSVGVLARELGWSPKHLISQFKEQVGLPPKTMARILRFNRVIGHLDEGDGRNWAEIAGLCGYYDQAHLVRDFKQFAGTTPSRFVLQNVG